MEFLIGGVIVLALLAWRFEGKKSDTHGSARWAPVWTVFRKGLFRRKGIMVGDWTGLLPLYYDSTHAITFGSSGSGKGTTAILPNLLSYRRVLVVDPGGENTATAAKCWRERGFAFGCINIFGMFGEEPWALPAQGFNPLEFLDPASPTFASDAKVFADMLTPRTGQEIGPESYFKTASRDAKVAFLVHIKTAEPPERQNLATLYTYVTCGATAWEKLLTWMKSNPACNGLVAQEASNLERIEAQSPAEYSGVMSTIRQDLNWLADPIVREGMSRNDVNFSVLKGLSKDQTGGIISVVLPLEYIESHAAIPRLALACAVLEMQRKPLAKDKVLFLIDEAAALGKLVRLPNWLATLRKYRVVIWTIWQNVGQLADLYGKGWQTLIGNCGLVQILGVGDPETAEHTEKLLGRCTIRTVSTNGRGERSTSESGRPLMFGDELRCMEEDRQIVFIGNLRPMNLAKTAYWKRPALAGRFYPNPYYDGKTEGAGLGGSLKALWGKVYYALVWWMAPHPVAACIILSPLALLLLSLFGGR